jgi:hypothetical protein
MIEPSIKVCSRCGASAFFSVTENLWRHKADRPWIDASSFCPKYGYPIVVVDKSLVEVVCEVLDGLVSPE